MGTGFQLLLLVGLLAVGVLVAWLRSRGDRDATSWGRLRQLGGALALALLTVGVLVTLSGTLHPNGVRSWMAVIALAVAAVLAFWPRLAPRLVPAFLVMLGLAGLVLAHPLAATAFSPPARAAAAPGPFGGLVNAGPDVFPSPGIRGPWQFLVLAMAYLFVLLGGWLAWHSPDPVLSRARHLLSGVTGFSHGLSSER